MHIANKKALQAITLEGLHPVFLTLFILCAFSVCRRALAIKQGRSSGFRILLLAAPSRLASTRQWHPAAFVPDYSGGTTPDFNGIPY
jgi:hypothetical protein